MTTEVFDSSNREQRFQEVLAAYLQAVEAGQQPDRDDWLKKHPDVAAELRSFFANQDDFARLAEPFRRRHRNRRRLGFPRTRRKSANASATSAITNCWRRSPAAAWASSTRRGRSAPTASWR